MESGSNLTGGSTADLPQSSARALDQIRAILGDVACKDSGRLPTERELAERLGKGRRAIRRALEVLEAEGLIWRKHGSGTYIGPRPALPPASRPLAQSLPASPASLMHMIEARLALEPGLARLAALRHAPEQMRRMRTYADRIASAEDIDGADLWDSALHREIAGTTGNPILLALFDQINGWRYDEGMRRIRLRARRHAGTISPVIDEHRILLDAIASGEGNAAATAMRSHLTSLQQVFLRYATEETTGHDI
ncbi:MAG: FadR/GntR family transcriptional regulator [Paracoccus sp. (in: a-proteobacteria)]|uniref:FadR/GntR family transcriptional regulator n=1 Tax=Paracoccus sp. TaxID=267 RepID=UPI0026E027FE|nr:FadR/GntR family transcriptional regulator [Paracoccus sp. (in: a-proteobacteria)]MDO5620339.1 FadR/GntR family transcriptional regulator [Paracoccus sp. (in: a-proteobacteria)]